MTSIDNIINAVSDGVARPNRYRVLFVDPFGLLASAQKLSATCEIAEIPGRHFATSERQTHGPDRKLPYQTVMNDITLSFICSGNLLEKRYFDLWQRKIRNPYTHKFSYYDDYTVNLLVSQLNEDGIPVFTCLMTEAYPMTIGSLPLNAADNDSYQKLPITFAYHRWLSEEEIVGGLIDGAISIPGLSEKISAPLEGPNSGVGGGVGSSLGNPFEGVPSISDIIKDNLGVFF